MDTLKRQAKRALILLVGIFFASTLASATTFEGGYTLTKEQAIEISLRSNTVQWYMLRARSFSLGIFYLDRTQVNELREEQVCGREELPESRSVWMVIWSIRTWLHANSSFSVISHTIDFETGKIINEGQMRA